MPGSGLAPLAARQLAAWEHIAEQWKVSREQDVWRCVECCSGVALADDRQGKQYQYTQEQWLALIVLHLRSKHPDLDPDKAV